MCRIPYFPCYGLWTYEKYDWSRNVFPILIKYKIQFVIIMAQVKELTSLTRVLLDTMVVFLLISETFFNLPIWKEKNLKHLNNFSHFMI